MLGDPVVSGYGNDYSLLTEPNLYVLTEKPDGECRFKVSVKVSYYGKGGLLVPEYMEVELDQGRCIIQFSENHFIKYLSPADGDVDANSGGYSNQVTSNVRVYRNTDFIIIEDTKCKTKIGYDSEGLGTKATIVVDGANGSYLRGQCGVCEE